MQARAQAALLGLAQRSLDLLVAGSVLASLLALGAGVWWVFDLFSHFRLQYVGVQVVALAVCIGVRRWFWVPVLGMTMLVNSIPLLPYLPTARGASLAQPMTLLHANVRARNPDASALMSMIERHRPDLLLLVEYTPRLAAELSHLHAEYPHRIELPAEDPFGLALMSRFPLIDDGVDTSGPTPTVRATVDSPAGAFELYGVHLLPPVSRDWAAGRNAALDVLAARPRHDHMLVCGDFNLSPYSPLFSRLLDRSGLRHAGRRRGFAITWPSFLPLMGVPIDHCLVGAGVLVGDVDRLGDIGSDHYPMLIEFDLERDP